MISSPGYVPPSPLEIQQRRDNEHINLLSIFHFVLAGFALLGIGVLFIHFLFMRAFVMNPNAWRPQPNSPQFPPGFWNIVILFYIAVGFLLVIGAILNTLSGIFLRRKTNRMFSLVVAGLDCLQIPFGTALGVFTILILTRETVRQAYKA